MNFHGRPSWFMLFSAGLVLFCYLNQHNHVFHQQNLVMLVE